MRKKLEALERQLRAVPKMPFLDAVLKDVFALLEKMVEQIELAHSGIDHAKDPPFIVETGLRVRLNAAARIAALVRRNIDHASGLYDGGMVPNLQSIIDIATIPDGAMPDDLEEQLQRLERV